MAKRRVSRLAFWGLYCLVLLALAEATMAGFHAYRTGTLIYTRDAGAGQVPAGLQLPGAVFQPYFGYTLRKGREGPYLDEGQWVTNNFGFQTMVKASTHGCCDYPYSPNDNQIIVGVFGGSVGSGFALQAQADGVLSKALREISDYRDKEIVVLNFSQPGFRQPQQVTTLAYFLSIGQRFDIVLNIDGFNEVVTSWKNWTDGVEPSFPADTLWGAWGRQLEQQKSTQSTDESRRADYHALGARLASTNQDSCFTALCFYSFYASRAYHQWREAVNTRSQSEPSQQYSLFPTQIVSNLPDAFNVFDHTMDVWFRSSLAMAKMSSGAGARYIHVLQPNQWYREAGPYSPMAADHIYQWVIEPVNEGYQRLRSKIDLLEAEGVTFFDASLLFKDEEARRVYVDDCCHYTPEGYGLLYEATAGVLASASLGLNETPGPVQTNRN